MNTTEAIDDAHRSTPSGAELYTIESWGEGLAFTHVAESLDAAIAQPRSVAVVQAPPGSGKTTLVPPIVANVLAREAQGGVGTENPERPPRVIVTQPRRVAARAAAHRLREIARAKAPHLDNSVAYTVRGESTLTNDSLIEFVTPGVLLRRMLADPGLSGVGAIVIDEVHERSLESDLVLALALDIRDMCDDLRVLALSATLDAPRFAELLGDSDAQPAPVIDSPTALHPVEIRWAPYAGARTNHRGVDRAYLHHVAKQAVAAHRERRAEANADVLVFVPGAWEVSEVAREIERLLGSTSSADTTHLTYGCDVFELHGTIDPRDQDRIVRGRKAGERPRIIVATAIAESSLTVPGVGAVVDSGLSREVRRDAARKISGLATLTTSRAGMVQRAGRAGRLGPGLAIRCFDSTVFAGAREHPLPEIAHADLADTALTLAAWGTPHGEGLRLADPLPRHNLADAHEALEAIGAIDSEHAITPLGKTLSEIPADPRLARSLVIAAHIMGPARAAEIVAALSLGEALPIERHRKARGAHSQLERETARLEKIAQRFLSRHGEEQSLSLSELPLDPEKCATLDAAQHSALVVALAYPDQIARKVSPGIYELAKGGRAALPTEHAPGSDWLAVAAIQRSDASAAQGTGAIIRESAPLTEDLALACGATLLHENTTVEFTDAGAKARREARLGQILLRSTPTTVEGDAAREAIRNTLTRDGLALFTLSDSAKQLRARLALLHHHLGAPWPDVSDAALIARVDELAGSELDALAGVGRSKPAKPAQIDFLPVLQRALPWPEAQHLDALAPEKIQVPSGSRITLEYPDDPTDPESRVTLSVKLQEMFGLAETPRIVNGRIPLLIHLLSPARRPLAVTDDLASFWAGPYAQVRKEMRGKYPKHPWPEDPTQAQATARTNRAIRADTSRT